MKTKLIIHSIALGLSFSGQAFGEAGGSMKGSIQESIQLKKDDKFVTPLFSGPFKVIGIGLMKGQKLEKHQTPTAAFLFVQSGSIVFSMAGKKESFNVSVAAGIALYALTSH